MKTIKFFALLCLIAVPFAITSCSSDDNGGGGGSASPGTIKAKVGSLNFTSGNSPLTSATKVSVGGGKYMINVIGTDMSGRSLQLMLNGIELEPNTYEIGGDNLISIIGTYTEINTSTFESSSWAAPHEGNAVVGSITITEISETNIKGNFHFNARKQSSSGGWEDDYKNVTNGAFNVDF